MPFKDPIKRREYSRQYNRRRNKSKVTLPVITAEQILSETIIHKNYVKVPLHNYKYEIVGYTKIDKDDYRNKYMGERLWKDRGGYARYKNTPLHILLMGPPPDKTHIYIDHINRDKLDNRRKNLRFVTPLENSQNSPMHDGGFGISGEKNITYCKREKERAKPWRYTRTFKDGSMKTKQFATLAEAKEYKIAHPPET